MSACPGCGRAAVPVVPVPLPAEWAPPDDSHGVAEAGRPYVPRRGGSMDGWAWWYVQDVAQLRPDYQLTPSA